MEIQDLTRSSMLNVQLSMPGVSIPGSVWFCYFPLDMYLLWNLRGGHIIGILTANLYRILLCGKHTNYPVLFLK